MFDIFANCITKKFLFFLYHPTLLLFLEQDEMKMNSEEEGKQGEKSTKSENIPPQEAKGVLSMGGEQRCPPCNVIMESPRSNVLKMKILQ